ncbi:hypothetical protein [Horticoccus sp. 23ND18S-11]|uniref:hypothetical protein n=1 Tax=Horticoccus sp. 23ND18S-11 TaxID=3391832 RepID=UPI0039C968D7
MSWTEISTWANANQGVLDLVAILVATPTLAILLYQGARKIWPTRDTKRTKVVEEFAHAESLKKEVEARAIWDKEYGFYGEFMIRDAERKLPNTEETHSSVETPYSIAVLTKIHTEHLEFTTGQLGTKHIKRIGDSWYFADATEEGAITVDVVFWLNYRDIVYVRWETDDYWEWPQVCCRFTASNKFPFSTKFFAEKKTGVPRPFYSQVCLLSDVSHRPDGLRSL